jgi:predicted permease
VRWIRRLFQKSRAEKELDRELRFHLERQIADYIAAGMTPEEARRRAQMEFGGMERVKEEVRDTRWETHLDNLSRDFRYALRNLRRDRRFALLAILALALGIGATTVIFSAIDSILLEPFVYKDPGRLAIFYIRDISKPAERGSAWFTVPEFMAFREQNHVFEDVAGGYYNWDVLYTDREGTQLFRGQRVTANSFELLGVKPFAGRAITSEDGQPGAPPVFVMSYRLWAQQFGKDPGLIGTSMTLNDQPMTLVGIMPPRFLWGNSDIWIPVRWSHTDINIGGGGGFWPLHFGDLARLKPGVSLQAAAADLDAIAQRLSQTYPKDFPPRFNVLALNYGDSVVGHFQAMLYILMAAVAMLLLIACSNVANLLLARATAREREIALRASMGASRGRLIQQLLVESFILAAAGCIAGCLFAYLGLRGIVAVIPPGTIPATAEVALKPVALWFALGVTILTTFLCGLAPAIHAVRGDLYPRLSSTGRGAGGGFRHGKLRAGLVIFEVALSILLLVGAGLMTRSLIALTHVNLGFNPSNVLEARLAFPKGRYDTADQQRHFFQQVLPRIAALPGVIAVTETTYLPPYGGGINSDVTVPGQTHSDRWNVLSEWVDEDFFRTLGIQLIRGRLLSEEDVDSARHVAVINQTLARQYFQNEDPIGQTIKFNLFDRLADAPHDAYFEIIGITADAKDQGLQDPPTPEAFVPSTISGGYYRGILVKTAVDPLSLLPSVRRLIWAVDSGVPLTSTGTVEGFLNDFSYAGPQFALVTLGVFAGIGLVLVIIGVFSVMAYSVSLQTQEFGVRMALGAQQNDILKMVLLKGLRLIGAGVVIGVLASYGLTRFLSSQIWGVSPTDPLTFAAVVTAIVAVGLAACLIPARRATHVDPLVALRYE